ncbi:MAG: GNAT family N-acetyltransferase [Chthoniobacterales bacterium]|nr:GNAT family N-acetyltransferase [Chthoniobacterales bacterium]
MEETISFRNGRARVLDGAALRSCETWQKALQRKAKDHRFYEIVEQTLVSGFEHRYVVLEDTSGNVRGVQPVFFVRQNLVEGVPALRAAVETIRRVLPRFLTLRLLMVGCVAGEGHLGACRPEDEEWLVAALHSTLHIYARRCGASLVVFKDFRSSYRTSLQALVRNGYTRVPSMPMTRLSLRYKNFDAYFASLSKATRKDLRRKFRTAGKAEPLALEVRTDVTAILDEIYPLYLQVHERSALKFETLTKDYFRELGQRMPDRVRFFLWRQHGRIVAFSLCLVHEGAIYDDYLGLDYRVALDLHLYFLSFRDVITWAIAQGLDRYLSSPLNYEPKLHFGCDLMPLDLYVKHTSPLLNRLFPPLLKLLEPTRHDAVLQRFANADEL